jgi:hypothetical protein
MRGSKFTEKRIIGILREQQGRANAAICCKYRVSQQPAYRGIAVDLSSIRHRGRRPDGGVILSRLREKR